MLNRHFSLFFKWYKRDFNKKIQNKVLILDNKNCEKSIRLK